MMTVKEVSSLSGVSIRTLHYYDQIGLLHPTKITDVGYRLYDNAALERLQQILLFRELEFPLKEIKEILDREGFDKNKAIDQQIELLTLKKEHLENLITYAREIKSSGVNYMNFQAFDTSKIDDYTKRAKEQWGNTKAYQEFEEKTANNNPSDNNRMYQGLMDLFVEFGKMKDTSVADEVVQNQVKKLQTYITEHFYECTSVILQGLGTMYSEDPEFKKNIDHVGGEGCAAFVTQAITYYCN